MLTSQKIIRVLGWVHLALFVVVAAMLAFVALALGDAEVAGVLDSAPAAKPGVVRLAVCLALGVMGVMELVTGILCLMAAKNERKATPILILSMLSVALVLYEFFTGGGLAGVSGGAVSAAVNIATFLCAVRIKSAP